MYYGQFTPPTDQVIAEYFPQNYVGDAIEVGASHGIAASNTLHFEQRGWNVLCIEPNPTLFHQLVRNRKNALPYAVGARNLDHVPFRVVRLVNGDETAVSALEAAEPLEAGRLFQDHRHLISGTRQLWVSLRTLDYCIAEFNRFARLDFVSIDTEGTELDVLRGFDLAFWRPRLLVIENNYESPEFADYLTPFGYRKDRRHGVNDFYVHHS